MNTVAISQYMGSELGEEVKDSLYDLPNAVWKFLRESKTDVESHEIIKNLRDISIQTNARNIERSLNRYVAAGVLEKKIRYGGARVLITGYKMKLEYLNDTAAPILCKRANIKELFVYFRFRDVLC